jgi:cytochrome c-type biogenesis protein CcsB
MPTILFRAALFLILLATGGMIVFIIKQKKPVFTWSYRIFLAGFVCHTVFLVQQYVALGAAPVLSLKSSLGFFAWTISGAYLLFQQRFRLRILGSFIAPLAAVLMLASMSLPGVPATVVHPLFKSVWLPIHVLTVFAGDGMFALAFVASVMYLLQERQIKRKRFGTLYSRLPSLETLDAISHRALIWGFPLLTVGMVTGAIYAQQALGSYWRWDPKEVWSLITWLGYAVLLHERLTVGWRGRKAAVLSIVCFSLLLFTFIAISLWASDYHSFKSLEGGLTS